MHTKFVDENKLGRAVEPLKRFAEKSGTECTLE